MHPVPILALGAQLLLGGALRGCHLPATSFTHLYRLVQIFANSTMKAKHTTKVAENQNTTYNKNIKLRQQLFIFAEPTSGDVRRDGIQWIKMLEISLKRSKYQHL